MEQTAISPSRAARCLLALAIVVCCVGCDQVSKEIARAQLKGQPPQSFFGNLFRLDYAENPGAFLGLGGELPASVRWSILVAVNSLLAVVIAGVLVFNWQMSLVRLLGGALLLAGAIGNLIDRVRFDGLVIDFLNVGVGPLRTGIFNIADMAIMAGAAMMIVPLYWKSDKENVEPAPAKGGAGQGG